MLTLIVLVAAGTVTGLLVGALLSGAWTARRFARRDGAFRCKLRLAGHTPTERQTGGCRMGTRWSHRRAYAMWVQDVLLVHQGMLRPNTVALALAAPRHPIRGISRLEVAGLGHAPLMLSVRLADGPVVELAVSAADRTLLAGPFLVAAVAGLSSTRIERP